MAVAQNCRGPWVTASQRHAASSVRTPLACTTPKCLSPYKSGHRQQIWRRAGRQRSLQCRAFSLPDNVDATLRNIISIAGVVGISYAVLLAAVSEPPDAPPPPQMPSGASRTALGAGAATPGPSRAGGPPAATRRAGSSSSAVPGSDDDNFVWGLMGFISILPLFSWLAWVLAAISDEDRAVLYGTYAALYGAPLLLRGLDWQDPWALFMVLLCAVHVQAERIAQTEPQTLQSVRPVAALGAVLRGAVGGTGAFLTALGGVLREDSRRVVRRPGSRSDGNAGDEAGRRPPAQLGPGDDRLQLGKDQDLVGSEKLLVDSRRDPSRDPELEDYATRELRQFDEQLRQAEKKRRQPPPPPPK